jgi:hypothetical protein
MLARPRRSTSSTYRNRRPRRNRSARFMIPLAVPGFPGQDVRSPVLRSCDVAWQGR